MANLLSLSWGLSRLTSVSIQTLIPDDTHLCRQRLHSRLKELFVASPRPNRARVNGSLDLREYHNK